MSGILEHAGGQYSVVYARSPGEIWRKALPDGDDVMIGQVNLGRWHWSGGQVCSIATDYRNIFVHYENAQDGSEPLVSCKASFHHTNPAPSKPAAEMLDWNGTAVECPYGTRVFHLQDEIASSGICPIGSHSPVTEADCAAASNYIFQPDGWPVLYRDEVHQSNPTDVLGCYYVRDFEEYRAGVVWAASSDASEAHQICICG